MVDKAENIYKEMQALCEDSRVTKRAHFIAAQEKKYIYRILGILIVIFNVLIGSTLIDLIAPTKSAIIIRIIAVTAAALAGLQTLFNFQKDVESHLNAGIIYRNINLRAKVLMAEYKDNSRSINDIINDFKTLIEQYLQRNTDSKSSIPADRHFDKARKAMKAKDSKECLPNPKPNNSFNRSAS
jgi:hypothetical protein